MKNISVLGSTGSIGVNTLDVVSRYKDRFRVIGLSADKNIELLASQARIFHPRIVCVGDDALAVEIKRKLPRGVKVVSGLDGLSQVAARSDADKVVFAISGAMCAIPLLAAIKGGKEIALANKESIVSAGEIIIAESRRKKVQIIPIDSEHSAIFQCLACNSTALSKIYLTGSGGPLRDVPRSKFDSYSKEAILKHPKWRMGKKISVDSATMMNKGLEVIEAMHLFSLNKESIEVLIHPEAIVHSMVEFIDGAVLAQLGVPDMRIPIQYALTYPDRLPGASDRVDFRKNGSLTFHRPDTRKFPCLGLAYEASRKGGLAPAVLNAADEEAVGAYLKGDIGFSDIPDVIEKVLARHKNKTGPILELADVLDADAWAREEAKSNCYH